MTVKTLIEKFLSHVGGKSGPPRKNDGDNEEVEANKIRQPTQDASTEQHWVPNTIIEL
jgi:hypothetical protein